MSLPVALEDELTGELKSAFVLPDVDQIVLRPPVCSSLSSVIYRKKLMNDGDETPIEIFWAVCKKEGAQKEIGPHFGQRGN